MTWNQFTEEDVYGRWSTGQHSVVPMPDGTPIDVFCECRNPEDPEVRLITAVSPDGKDYTDHEISPGVYDELHLRLRDPARKLLGPSRDELLKLWQVVTSYRDKVELTCAETIYQTDRCQVDATQFMESCIEVVGCGTYDEDTDKYVSPGV